MSPLFASMYAVGFEGGHGTAAGLADTYTALGEPTYGDIALTAATIGILMGSICGVILVNWGLATGKVAMHNGTVVPLGEDLETGSEEEAVEKKEVEGEEQLTIEVDEEEGNEKSLCKKMFGDRYVPPDIYKVDDTVDGRLPQWKLLHCTSFISPLHASLDTPFFVVYGLSSTMSLLSKGSSSSHPFLSFQCVCWVVYSSCGSTRRLVCLHQLMI